MENTSYQIRCVQITFEIEEGERQQEVGAQRVAPLLGGFIGFCSADRFDWQPWQNC